MIEILKFIFQDFEHFWGTAILIYVIGEALSKIIHKN